MAVNTAVSFFNTHTHYTNIYIYWFILRCLFVDFVEKGLVSTDSDLVEAELGNKESIHGLSLFRGITLSNEVSCGGYCSICLACAHF